MDYYVYVYVDPRNFEEFYYGKGKGSRKSAHLDDKSDTAKTRRIADIKKVGLQPVVRVIARGLSESDAFLIEKTLLWKLGKSLTNVSRGHFSEKFRPQNSMHHELPGFDYLNGIYYYNVGEGPHRTWEDYRKFGFVSAGQGDRWRKAINRFNKGDLFGAFVTKKGFVGIGRIIEPAQPIRNVKINGKPLLSLNLHCKNMGANVSRDDKCEHVALVTWIETVAVAEAKRVNQLGLFTPQAVHASLEKHPKTRDFLERQFGVSFAELSG
jgi:hypothetical protein